MQKQQSNKCKTKLHDFSCLLQCLHSPAYNICTEKHEHGTGTKKKIAISEGRFQELEPPCLTLSQNEKLENKSRANAAYVTLILCAFSIVLSSPNALELLLFCRPLLSNTTVLCLKNWDFFFFKGEKIHCPLLRTDWIIFLSLRFSKRGEGKMPSLMRTLIFGFFCSLQSSETKSEAAIHMQ